MTSTCSNADWWCRPGNDWPRSGTWQPARPPSTSGRRSCPGAAPRPRRAAHEDQRETERQVLDRSVGDAAVAQEHDSLRTHDGGVAVTDDPSTRQPAIGEQLEEHDDPVCRPPGPRAHESRPQDQEVCAERDHHGDRGRDGVRAHGGPVSYTHLRAHETVLDLVCRLLLEKKKK